MDDKMTLASAIGELRSIALSLENGADSAGYVERLEAIADFLDTITWIERED